MKALLRLLPILALGFVLAACSTTDYQRSNKSRRADARANHQPRRVTVCHNGHRTLRLDRRAARAHIRHGDRQGVCRDDRRHDGDRNRGRRSRNRRR